LITEYYIYTFILT